MLKQITTSRLFLTLIRHKRKKIIKEILKRQCLFCKKKSKNKCETFVAVLIEIHAGFYLFKEKFLDNPKTRIEDEKFLILK